MIMNVLTALGGLGLFLLGMQILTEGLKGLAGGALRRALKRFTRSPATGATTGALATAVVQSSSAVTVAAVGFVGAGLMTFSQALGIIFGANIGTTITGWIVAIVGFKLDLGHVLLPLVLVGALMRLFGSGRLRDSGWALLGFALLFVGIDTLQTGMEAFEGVLTPDRFPGDTLWGRFELVLIGVVLTVITQSSSAGVATALVALDAGAITFPQAAAMVIGMDVGTTFTAALATLGGSTAMRRTGYAHVIYNMLTGVMAFALLTPYTALASRWFDLSEAGDAQIALVAFHTSFNVLGVMLVIGFTQRFARLVIRLVPERGPDLVHRLDDRLLSSPHAAIDALLGTARDIADSLFAILGDALEPGRRPDRARLAMAGEALVQTRLYAQRVHTAPEDGLVHERHQAILHALDHLTRLAHRLGQAERIGALARTEPLRGEASRLREAIRAARGRPDGAALAASFDDLRKEFRGRRQDYRTQTIERAVRGGADAGDVTLRLDAMRWLHRVSYHVWRITHHLRGVALDAPALPARGEEALDVAED